MEKSFRGHPRKTAKLDFTVLYNIDEEVPEGYTDWISPLHDHARVSFAVESIGETSPHQNAPHNPGSKRHKEDSKWKTLSPTYQQSMKYARHWLNGSSTITMKAGSPAAKGLHYC